MLTARLFYRAIKLNIKLYKWDRALAIAVENKTHVDTVIAYRQRYLQRQFDGINAGKEKREGDAAAGPKETNPRFQQYSKDIVVDWETVKAKIRADKEREEEANK